MNIIIQEAGNVIWAESDDMREGICSTGYARDGTQDRIISALEYALVCARFQRSCWLNGDGMAEFQKINSRSDNDVPVTR
ncbi:Rrf2 family transcriptional regulator [Salmonella enterica]|nr:Rrf2 family transcriptional regulator [Salmonella enterica]